MRLNLLPHKLALLSAAGAFGVVWIVGLLCDVQTDAIALRSVVGAAIFWLVGLWAGKVFLNGLCDALGEHMRTANQKPDPRRGGDR